MCLVGIGLSANTVPVADNNLFRLIQFLMVTSAGLHMAAA